MALNPTRCCEPPLGTPGRQGRVASTALGWFALAGVIAWLIIAPVNAEALNCNLDGGEERTVTRIVDGETMIVDGGGEVRLAGAMSPQAFDTAGGAQDWPLAIAARTELERLVSGRSVTLAFAGRRTDRYGRLLAHVFVAAGDDKGGAHARIWVQGEMLRQGLARAYALEAGAQCLDELISHEALARQPGLGLWAETAYAIRKAEEIPALLRFAGTYQIVEGRVRAIADVRGSTYLNFGEDFRQDFTAVIRPAARRAMAGAGTPQDQLDGAVVRVRGWIERRGGPLIEVVHNGMIEVIEAKPAATAGAAPSIEPATPRRSRRRPDPR